MILIVISLYLLCFIFSISSLLLFVIVLSLVITNLEAIVKSLPLVFAIAFKSGKELQLCIVVAKVAKAITKWEAI